MATPKVQYVNEGESIIKSPKESRMIEVTIRLYTNVKENGGMKSGHAFGAGTVRVSTNALHDIKPQGNPVRFHSFFPEEGCKDDLVTVVHEALVSAGVKFVRTGTHLRD